MVKASIDVVKNTEGRVESGTVTIRGKTLRFNSVWDDNGHLKTITFEGQTVPSMAELYLFMNEKFIERVRKIDQSGKHDSKTYKTAVFDASASGNLVAAVKNKVIKLHAAIILAQNTVVINLNNGSGGASLFEMSSQAREGIIIPMADAPAYWAITAVNTALYVTLSAAVVVTITAIYSDDDAS